MLTMQAYARAPVLTVNGGNGGFDGYRWSPSTQSGLKNILLLCLVFALISFLPKCLAYHKKECIFIKSWIINFVLVFTLPPKKVEETKSRKIGINCSDCITVWGTSFSYQLTFISTSWLKSPKVDQILVCGVSVLNEKTLMWQQTKMQSLCIGL